MRVFILILQGVSAVLLTIAILLHTAKGEGLGGIGGQARLFGSTKGMEESLDKITGGLALIFLLVSLALGITNV